MADFFDEGEYRERIGLQDPVTATETGLERLHRAQVYRIPFENLDIHLGRGIDVSPAAVYAKIVGGPRGGYCFELNGLFLTALRCLGFEARALLARVHVAGKPGGRTHQLSLVTMGGREWIADVGFGAASLHGPMPLETGRVSRQGTADYRLVEASPFGTMLQVADSEVGWRNLYSFDRETVIHADTIVANHYTATNPDSFFTRMRIANLINPRGRTSLADLELTVVRDGETSSRPIGEEEYLTVLQERFGIGLDATYDELRPPALG